MRQITTFILLFPAILTFGQELLTNGDFENGTESWDYWENSALGFDGELSIINDSELQSNVARVDVNAVGDGYWTFKFFNIRLRQNGFSVDENDLLRVSFKAKSFDVVNPIFRIGIAPEAQEGEGCSDINDCFWQLNMADYELVNFNITDEWATYEADIPVYSTTDDVHLVIRVGEKTGAYFMDDISLQRTGKLAFTNDWYANSQARIDTLRKNDFALNVTDSLGNPIPNASISVNHLNHDFEWGTAVAASTWSSTWQKNVISDMFNGIVNEDHFKWHRIEWTQGNTDYTYPNRFADWANENGMVMRGHTLFWPRRSTGLLPGWVNNLSDSDRLEAMETRIRRDMGLYVDRIKEYDVVNEPFHNPFLHETYTDTIYKWIYDVARASDPTAKLYVNEWGNIDLWEHVRYGEFVTMLQEMGTPLDGMGLQAHLNKPVNWKQLKYKLDYLDDFGLPLKITEFDQNVGVNGHSELEQARDYGIAMRTVFSHPSVEGLYLWTLITGYSNTVESIYNSNGTKRAAADTMFHLIREVWTTNDSGTLTENGAFDFNGYYGNYKVEVNYLGETYSQEINFSKDVTTQPIQLATKVNLVPTIQLQMNGSMEDIEVGQEVSFSIDAEDPEDLIRDIALYINEENVANFGGDTNYLWIPDEEGEYEIVAQVTDDIGQVANSDTLTIQVMTKSVIAGFNYLEKVFIFPIPADQKIQLKGIIHQTSYAIIDLSGKVCGIGAASSANTTIDLSHLKSGIYTLLLNGQTGKKELKFIINR